MTANRSIPKLKPCPFCGGEAELKLSGVSAGRVICGGLDCRMEVLTFFEQSHEDAARVWNTRAKP